MKLSKQYKDGIINEFDHVLKKTQESKNVDELLYYLSGIQSYLQRVFNFEYSKDLLFVWFVMDRVYKDIYGLTSMVKNGEIIPTFEDDFGDRLIEVLTEIKNSLFNEKDRIKALKNYVELMYTCTGNGFYLTSKGMIDLSSDSPKLKDSK